MSPAMRFGAFTLVIMSSVSAPAGAHPMRVDVPPADCTVKTGGPLTTPDGTYVQSDKDHSTDVVCPVVLPTESNAGGSAQLAFEVRYEALAAAGPNSNDFRCQAWWDFAPTSLGSAGTSGWVYADFSAGASSFQGNGSVIGPGIIKSTQPQISVPANAGDPPFQLAIHCFMTASSRIHEIRVLLN